MGLILHRAWYGGKTDQLGQRKEYEIPYGFRTGTEHESIPEYPNNPQENQKKYQIHHMHEDMSRASLH